MNDRIRNRIFIAFLFISEVLLLIYCSCFGKKTFLAGGIVIVLQMTLLAVLTVTKKRISAKNETGVRILGGVSREIFTSLAQPLVIFGRDGAIVWYNQSFADAVGEDSALYDSNLASVIDGDFTVDDIASETEAHGEIFRRIASIDEKSYKFEAYRFNNTEKCYYLAVFSDRSRIVELENEFAVRNPVICYVSIDNYSEATGTRLERYRDIAVKIATLLGEWAESIHGILRETGRDKYILVLEEKDFNSVVESRFEILDNIRALSTDVDIPLTVSIGAACTDGSLREKELLADQALDLSLQRGGDQAVVKGRGSTEYYGGRTKTVQKRTKVRSRIIAGELCKMFSAADNVIIMGHKYADQDSMGSCVGIARLAMTCSKKVNIVVNLHNSNLKGVFQKLRGIDEYRNVFIDSVMAQDMITPSTVVVIVDVNNHLHFECPEIYENCPNVAVIDHHRKIGEFPIEPAVAYIEPSASSASELVSEILEQVIPPGGLLKEEAELLFSGIILDTKQFTRNTGVRTFSAAHYLRGEGASPGEAQMLFKTGLDDFLREIKFESNIVIYRDIIAISIYEGSADDNDKIAASKAAERLLGVEGVLASFALCTIDGMIHISARSTGTVNVQLILEKVGGGGHFDVAGAQLGKTMSGALTSLKDAIDEYLDEE